MREYLDCLNKYATFAGRASRREYWMFIVFNTVMAFGVGLIATPLAIRTGFSFLADAAIYAYALLVLLPGLSVAVRRLHDLGMRGWWLLVSLVPVLGSVALLVLFCLPGEKADNRFGRPSPTAAEREVSRLGLGEVVPLSPVVAGGVGLLAFLLGATWLHVVMGEARADLVFRCDAPFFGAYHVLLMGLMCALSGLALKLNTSVRSKLWGVILTLGILEVAFMVHLVVAYAYYGLGMSFIACLRGFTGRCTYALLLTGMSFCMIQAIIVALFGVAPVRRRLERSGLCVSGYWRNCLRLVWWTGLLGLLVYELVLLLVFVSRGWWAGT